MIIARYAVGIDPGKKTGYAVYDRTEQKISVVETMDFWGVYERCRASNPGNFDVFIEVPRCKKNWHGRNGAAADVGGIVREANLLADGIEALGIKVARSHPTGKFNAAHVKRITGYTGRTNEHTRDAIMLCWKK